MFSSSPSKAPDDPGAFGMLGPDQQRILKGTMYWVGARIAQERRSAADWNMSLLHEIHRELFDGLFPKQAAQIRQVEVTFPGHDIPVPAKIQYRLNDLITDAQDIIRQGSSIDDKAERIQAILPRIARFHAHCIMIQPFIDGNKRRARQVLSALMVDCDFPPGVRIGVDERLRYLESIDKSAVGNHDQLAEIILEGWMQLERDFSSGAD